MTGPEHYREAERLVAEATRIPSDDPDAVAGIARAQVHATLALAAATAICVSDESVPVPDWEAWRSAAAEPTV